MNDSGSHALEEVSVTPAVTARSRNDRRGQREGRVGLATSAVSSPLCQSRKEHQDPALPSNLYF